MNIATIHADCFDFLAFILYLLPEKAGLSKVPRVKIEFGVSGAMRFTRLCSEVNCL